ncbi:hypothetical protein A2706_00030 [Candidatus Peribacteria bacterium RIFCSPHIGHO2_01_FULL_51_35]|nr:MAG: hypothetical protein A2706_00030 [Candidatus Peribacteria bacterium RIFCSPHIGHO2_01_FULL_51_35]
MLENKKNKRAYKKIQIDFKSIAILTFFSILAVFITYVLYSYTSNLLKERLQDRLIAISSTAATQFSVNEIDQIKDINDMKKPAFASIINKLQKIRAANENIRFAYLMRKTNDASTLEFIADADSLTPQDELDVNENGIIEEDEVVPLPGDPYDIEPYPVLKEEAFDHPSVDRELQPDQWGLIMATYAPIVNENGNAVAIVGLDILVNDFYQKTREALLPFIVFILFLILALSLLTLLLMRLWNERVEAVKELDRQKDELISMVSHQLAAPVTAIKWYIEMLLDNETGDLNKEQKEQLITMQKVGADLNDLISMILDVSRIQLGRIKLDPQPLNINEFINEILNVIEPKAKEKEIIFVKEIEKSLPDAKLDKRMTRMTIENLLTNAIKYTSKGGNVLLKMKMMNNNILRCEVKDTGCGIPKSEHDKIFGKLFRASNVRNNVDGNGFGLYVAKGAIEGQGGKIWFESKENIGSTFFVELPLVLSDKKNT